MEPELSSTEHEGEEPVIAAVNFKAAVCQLLDIEEKDYERVIFRKVMFLRARLLGCFITPLHADFHFQERNLIRQVASAESITEVKTDIDFYQHKYVVSSTRRSAMGVRLSGKRLLKLAKLAFAEVSRAK